MVRGYQFNKVEMVQYTTDDGSDVAFEELVKKAQKLVEGLGLCYQVDKLAAGDCSHSMARTYDIEVWIPSMHIYKEVSSVSNARDYQARRGMETFTSSLSVLIQIISIVLIVFAAISLVVSSVMTGIITYVSVVERTKEIGILRACGARKKDVGRLFEAECTIIGFGAGIIGIAFTYIVCIPINLILDHQFPGNNLSSIALLNPWHALILLALAVVLALVSGLIPSRMAAKKDPVVALRTE